MNPYRLLSPKTNTPTNVYVCGVCNHILQDEGLAERCCKPCPCGQPSRNRFEEKCSDCWDREYRERRAKQLVEAELVDWDGESMLHCEEFSDHRDGWFETPDCIIEYCHMHRIKIPQFAFVGRRMVQTLDLDHAVESMLEDTYEDAEIRDAEAYKKLATAVEEFNRANAITYYEHEYKRKVQVREVKPTTNPVSSV